MLRTNDNGILKQNSGENKENQNQYEISNHKKYDSSSQPLAVSNHPHTFVFQENKSYLERNTISQQSKKQENYLASLRDHPTVATRITAPAPSYFEALNSKSDNSEEGANESFSFQSPRPGVVGFPGDAFQLESSDDSPRQLKTRGPTISQQLDTISYLREKKKIYNEAIQNDANDVISEMLKSVMDQEATKIATQSIQFVKAENSAIQRVFREILIQSMVDEVVKESLDEHIQGLKMAQVARSVTFSIQDELTKKLVKKLAEEVIYEEETERAACKEIIQDTLIDQQIVETAFLIFQSLKDICFLEKVAISKSDELMHSFVQKIVRQSCIQAIQEQKQEQNKLEKQTKQWKQAQTQCCSEIIKRVLKQETKLEVKLHIAETLAQEQKQRKLMRIPKQVLDDILRKQLLSVVNQSVGSLDNEKIAISLYFQDKLCSSFYHDSVREVCTELLNNRQEQLSIIESVGTDIIRTVKLRLLDEIVEEEKNGALAQDTVYRSVLESSARNVLSEAALEAISENYNLESILKDVVASQMEKLAFQSLMEERRKESEYLKSSSFSFYSSSDVRRKKYSVATADGEEQNWMGLEMSQIQRRQQPNDSTGDLTIEGFQGTDSDSVYGDECNAEPEQEMKINEIKEFRSLRLMQELQLHHSIPIDANFIDVLCVNCYECVKLTDVNTHSKVCQRPIQKQQQQPNDRNLVDINDRIFKLSKSIDSRLKDLQKNSRSSLTNQEVLEYEQVLGEISRFGSEIFFNNSYPIDLHLVGSKLQTMVFSLTLTRSFYFSTKVYAERLIQLLSSKLEVVEGMCQQSSDAEIMRQTEDIGDPYINEILMEEELKDIEAKFNDQQLVSGKMSQNLAHVHVIQNKMLNEFMKEARVRRQAGLSEVNSEVDARGPLSLYSSTTTGLESVKNLY